MSEIINVRVFGEPKPQPRPRAPSRIAGGTGQSPARSSFTSSGSQPHPNRAVRVLARAMFPEVTNVIIAFLAVYGVSLWLWVPERLHFIAARHFGGAALLVVACLMLGVQLGREINRHLDDQCQIRSKDRSAPPDGKGRRP